MKITFAEGIDPTTPDKFDEVSEGLIGVFGVVNVKEIHINVTERSQIFTCDIDSYYLPHGCKQITAIYDGKWRMYFPAYSVDFFVRDHYLFMGAFQALLKQVIERLEAARSRIDNATEQYGGLK